MSDANALICRVYEAVSEEEALNLLFLGNMNRVTSDTPMNQVRLCLSPSK